MKIVWQFSFFVLTLFADFEAKSIGSRDSTPSFQVAPTDAVKKVENYASQVLVFVELLKDGEIGGKNSDWTQPHVLLVVHRPDEPVDNGKDIITSDPNILLMLENFQSKAEWPESSTAPRLARDMSRDDSDPASLETGTSRGNYYDVWLVPRRSRTADPYPPSASLLPPPAHIPVTTANQYNAEYGMQAGGNRVSGRSISSTNVSPNHSYSSDDDAPDFLSTLVTLPQVWMHDLSHMIIQPLRKPSSGERDSFEYFGMVGKAPFIQCPLGFKKSSLGTCRPVFRSRRNYPLSSAQGPELETTTMAAATTTTTIVATTVNEENENSTATSISP